MNKYEEAAKRRWEIASEETRKAVFTQAYAFYLRMCDPENPNYIGNQQVQTHDARRM